MPVRPWAWLMIHEPATRRSFAVRAEFIFTQTTTPRSAITIAATISVRRSVDLCSVALYGVVLFGTALFALNCGFPDGSIETRTSRTNLSMPVRNISRPELKAILTTKTQRHQERQNG